MIRRVPNEPRPELLGALLERDFEQGRREELAKKGHALRTSAGIVFPIETAADAQNAQTLWQSGHHKTDAAKAFIVKRAKALGAKPVVQALTGGS